MAIQTTFERYELKYLLDPRQKARVLEAMEPYMALDNYGRTTIRNIYMDTGSYRLIRRSLEKPAYKEKLRIRRVTFDENILYRLEELSLESQPYGTPILAKGSTLMELKISGGIPLWMSHVLNRCGIYKTSFSKYGTAYQDMMASHLEGGLRYA
ncbi:VTC domain-containing protein [Pseudoflavonifractor phocaeensis]|uniref:VTC domain-containing protein n=1 Tax=Pseudoflavonifractor phocaeensis TaxID=1870988 RepID=UPI00195CDFBF|nr:VTC domain-containing protein [Pseudoflavonifractor phocaeensis]MBM6924516.1 VTC domain-containing protein [Pseudoflavonifractor phocaeensis]